MLYFSIDDILADSDSDLPEEMDEDDNEDNQKGKGKAKKQQNTFIREDPEDIVDLADIKSIGNVLSKNLEFRNLVNNNVKLKHFCSKST